MVDPSPRAVALQPEWLPHSFSPDGSLIASVHVPRVEHDRLTFLSDQFFQNRYPQVVHNRTDIEGFATQAPQGPLHFIFHTAFCCSTLLVKALTVPGRVMGLKEPIVMNDLALRLARDDDPALPALLDLTAHLLARPFDARGAVLAKASNVANRLIEPLLDGAPESRAVLLYADVTPFLLAIAKHGAPAHQWSRQLFESLVTWTPLDFDPASDAQRGPADLRVAALAWLIQIRLFDRIAKKFGRKRVMLLDEFDLLEDPRRTLHEVSNFLSLRLEPKTIAAIVEGPVFHSHSKAIGARYSIDDRRRDQAAVIEAHGAEISAASAWLRELAGRHGAPLRPAFAD